MNKKVISRLLVLGAVFSFFAHTAWAKERIIFSNDDSRVVLSDNFECLDQTAKIRIESTSPEIFEGRAARIQTMVDSTQAVLRYECPGLKELQVDGYMLGLNQPVYSAVSSSRKFWVLDVKKVISSDQVEQANKALQSNPQEYAGILGQRPQIAIATINLGMEVEEVKDRIGNVFDADPSYERVSGIINLELGGCPEDYFKDTGYSGLSEDWKCIRGWFTDRRIARLYRLGYTQVSTDSIKSVRQALVDHFGAPVVNKRIKKKHHELIWETESKDNSNRSTVEQLHAGIRRIGKLTVIDLFLEAPELAAQHTNSNVSETEPTSSKLKL